jgi:hypothetical protein
VVARLAHPRGFRLLSAGDGWALGRSRDDLDVEYLEVYAVEPRTDEGG